MYDIKCNVNRNIIKICPSVLCRRYLSGGGACEFLKFYELYRRSSVITSRTKKAKDEEINEEKLVFQVGDLVD
jgi:predicted acylesterase/phospholipase RssA